MTTKATIRSKCRPRDMFATLLKPMAEAQKGSCSGGCRAKTLTNLNREGMAACQSGDLEGAGRILAQGIELARKAGVAMYEAKLRNNLGLVYMLAARPCEAASEFGLALALVENKLGRDNSLFKRIKNNLSQTFSA